MISTVQAIDGLSIFNVQDPVVASESECSRLNVTSGERGNGEGSAVARYSGEKAVRFEPFWEAFPVPDLRHLINEPEVCLTTTIIDGVAVAIATGIPEFLRSRRVVNHGRRVKRFQWPVSSRPTTTSPVGVSTLPVCLACALLTRPVRSRSMLSTDSGYHGDHRRDSRGLTQYQIEPTI